MTLLPYLTVAANLIFVLGVLCSVSQRVRQLRARGGKHEAALESETARLSAEISELKTKLQVLEETGNPHAARGTAAAGATGVNSTLRSKVLKMHRLGPVTRANRRISAPPQGRSGSAGKSPQHRHAALSGCSIGRPAGRRGAGKTLNMPENASIKDGYGRKRR